MAGPDSQQFHRFFPTQGHRAGIRTQRLVLKERCHRVPVGSVSSSTRQAPTELVPLTRPINRIEPISGVIRVPIERLRPKQLGSRGPEGYPLPKGHRRVRKDLGLHPVFHRRGQRQLPDSRIKQRLIIMGLNIVDALLRLLSECGTLPKVVNALGHYRPRAIRQREGIVANGANQTDLHQIHLPVQLRYRFIASL